MQREKSVLAIRFRDDRRLYIMKIINVYPYVESDVEFMLIIFFFAQLF